MKPLDLHPLKNLDGPILITGHTGFKGAWLTLLLDQLGIEWAGISLPPLENSLYIRTRHRANSEKFLDIRNFGDVEIFIHKVNPSFIIHMAAEAQVFSAFANPVRAFETNVVGTINILEAARNLPRLNGVVVSTTDKVYLNTHYNQQFTENDPLGGNEPYSASKVGQEAVIDAWLGLPRNKNFPITSVRAGNVIGGGDVSSDRLLPDLVRAFESKTKLKIRNLRHTRPWQHALDPLYGYLLVCVHQMGEKVERAFNFGPSGLSMSVEEVLEYARIVLGSEFPEIVSAGETSLIESPTLSLSSEKAMALLNWSPVWDQTNAIKSTLDWWLNIKNSKSPKEASFLDIQRLLSNHSIKS